MSDRDLLPERIKAARELKKMTQADLSKAAKIPSSSISNFETGTRKPSFSSLSRLATALEVTTDFLLGRGETEVRAKPRYVMESVSRLILDISLFSSGRVSELINQAPNVSVGVSSYQECFAKEAKSQEANGNRDAADTLHLLYIVCDFALRPDDTKNPFQPRSWIGNARSPLPEDLSELQIVQLGSTLDFLSDSQMIARISDVVWVRLKKVDYARRAISAYLLAAQDARAMEMERFWCLERAFRLAKQINSIELAEECVGIFNAFKKEEKLYATLSLNLLSLAQDLTILSSEEIAREASVLAEGLASHDPFYTKDLNDLAAAHFKKIDDEKSAAECHLKTAESFLKIAEEMDAMHASNFIQEALDAYKRAGGHKAEISRLNKLLTEKGRQSATEMKLVQSEPIDFSSAVKAAKKLVEGLAPMDALAKVAFQFPVLSYEEHKAEVEESIKNYPLRYFISANYISRDGRQYSRRPSFMSDDPKEIKIALDTEIAASMAQQIEVIVRFCLKPALGEIHWTTRDLTMLINELNYRPIVPPHRAEFFYRGIKAGLEGDFIGAAHILIPQLENSLRFLLEARGLTVTTLDSENLHSEISLNKIFELYSKEITEMFGSADLTYFMESFLCSKSGQNFRNELSHGLVSNPGDYRFALAWWLTVYLLFLMKFPDTKED